MGICVNDRLFKLQVTCCYFVTGSFELRKFQINCTKCPSHILIVNWYITINLAKEILSDEKRIKTSELFTTKERKYWINKYGFYIPHHVFIKHPLLFIPLFKCAVLCDVIFPYFHCYDKLPTWDHSFSLLSSLLCNSQCYIVDYCQKFVYVIYIFKLLKF